LNGHIFPVIFFRIAAIGLKNGQVFAESVFQQVKIPYLTPVSPQTDRIERKHETVK